MTNLVIVTVAIAAVAATIVLAAFLARMRLLRVMVWAAAIPVMLGLVVLGGYFATTGSRRASEPASLLDLFNNIVIGLFAILPPMLELFRLKLEKQGTVQAQEPSSASTSPLEQPQFRPRRLRRAVLFALAVPVISIAVVVIVIVRAPAEPILARIVDTIPVGNGPFGVIVAPDGGDVYIANNLSDYVSVIDADSRVSSLIRVGHQPRRAVATSDSSHVYVTPDSFSGEVLVIDTDSRTVTATIRVDGDPDGMTISPDGRSIYLVNYGLNTVSVIDTARRTVTATIRVGDRPRGVAAVQDGRQVYVTNSHSSDVSVIDTASNTVTNTIPVGREPKGVAVAPDGRHIYVTNYSSDSVSVIEISGG